MRAAALAMSTAAGTASTLGRTLLGVAERCAARGLTGRAADSCTGRLTRVRGGAGGKDDALFRCIAGLSFLAERVTADNQSNTLYDARDARLERAEALTIVRSLPATFQAGHWQ